MSRTFSLLSIGIFALIVFSGQYITGTVTVPTVVDAPNTNNGNNDGDNGNHYGWRNKCCWPPKCRDIVNYDSLNQEGADRCGYFKITHRQPLELCGNDTRRCFVLTNIEVDIRPNDGSEGWNRTPVWLHLAIQKPDGTLFIKRSGAFLQRPYSASGVGLTVWPGDRVVLLYDAKDFGPECVYAAVTATGYFSNDGHPRHNNDN